MVANFSIYSKKYCRMLGVPLSYVRSERLFLSQVMLAILDALFVRYIANSCFDPLSGRSKVVEASSVI